MEASQTIENSYKTFQSKQIHRLAKNSDSGKSIGSAARAEKALGEFQGLMIGMMLNSMRSTIPKNDLVNGGQGEEMFQQMLDTEYSKKGGASNMLQLNKSFRRALKLPLSETFNWAQLERVDETKLKEIQAELNHIDPLAGQGISKNEPVASKATKQLDRLAKNNDLLGLIPEEKRNNLDKSFLDKWNTKLENYKNEKGISAQYGPELWQMNKELLEEVYPAIKVKNNLELYKRATKAYETTAN